MKSLIKTITIKDFISQFITLQNQLINKFREGFPEIKDLEYLLDCPRNGYIETLGEKWYVQRHGAGICFKGEQSGKVIDVHKGIFSYENHVNSWGLLQYLESIGIDKINYQNQVLDVSDLSEFIVNEFLKQPLVE